MAFCTQCGKPAAAGSRFCAACGAPLEGTTSLDGRARRQGRLFVALALAFAVLAGGALYYAAMAKRAVAVSAVSAPAPAVAAPAATQPQASPQAGTPPPQASITQAAPGIDLQAVQNAVAKMAPKEGASSQQAALPVPAGSDRYPGSQPMKVDAALPDIGIPVSQEVYSTTDSVDKVIAWYKQRYPDAMVTEVNGQKVVAVDRPGLTKVIAVGTSGSETRIAVVQPGGQ